MATERPDLTPIYLAEGDVCVVFADQGAVIRRGAAVVDWPLDPETIPVTALAKLPQWQAWIRSARVATLRFLARWCGLAAGCPEGLTAPVRSQLSRAGLIRPSPIYGWDLEAARGMDVWARIELARRERKTISSPQEATP